MGRGANNTGSQTILYGATPPRGQAIDDIGSRDDLAEGVVINPYPKAFVKGYQWFPEAIADRGVRQLLPSERVTISGDKVLYDLRQSIGDRRIPAHTGTELVWPNGEPLHALMIEKLPEWKKPHNKDGQNIGTRYGQHLGIGVYVYDSARERWYQRCLHGRSVAAASARPLKTHQTANKKREQLAAAINNGNWRAEEKMYYGYPSQLAKANR